MRAVGLHMVLGTPGRRRPRARPFGAGGCARHRPGGADRHRSGLGSGTGGRTGEPGPALFRGRDAARDPGGDPRGVDRRFLRTRRDAVPAGHQPGVDLGPGARRGGGHRHRASTARRRGAADAGPRTGHRTRCPLGPTGGDLRRGSRAGQPHGCRLRARGAVAGCRRHRQTFPRLRRAGRGLQLGLVLSGSPPPARRHRGAVPRRHQRGRASVRSCRRTTRSTGSRSTVLPSC